MADISLIESLPPVLKTLTDVVARVSDRLKKRTAIVGGAVRDLLLKRVVSEIDFVTEDPVRPMATELATELSGSLIFHERFKTATVRLPDGQRVDITTARVEEYDAPAALPRVRVGPGLRIEDDLLRRDFSINAMALLVSAGERGGLLDPFSGQKDLNTGVLRILHKKSFEDDPTRLFRAARFSGRYGYHLDAETEACRRDILKSPLVSTLSPVRRRHEFDLILKEEDPIPAMRLLYAWGLIPKIYSSWDFSAHAFDARLRVLTETKKRGFEARLALWLAPFGRSAAEQTLIDLVYEKVVKKAVLSELDRILV